MMPELDIPPHTDLAELLQLAIDAARGPAEVILRYFHQENLPVERKADSSPVTQADKEAERYIRETLAAHSSGNVIDILGEEHGLEGTGARFRWTIDPIDGTRSFVRGIPLFGTIVALEDTIFHRALVGVIHLPALGTTYSAARGFGSWCDDKKITISSTSKLEDAIVSVGDPLQFVQAKCEGVYHRLGELCSCLRGYTDCFGHGLVAQGSVDVMFDPDLNPWDVLATYVLVEEAGGAMLSRPSNSRGKVDVLFGNVELVDRLSHDLGF
ncbi:MAG: hypothetical protein MRJ96_01050 [Nitrospirales bacterium]|nr:hypothetical protein [Nitrospira sp.]MDR4500029.1 hypothetical protein [Nitrospirales bacterium]